jgi:hypothetical protein
MRRLLVLILGFLAAWLGTTLPADAAVELPTHPELVHVYTYDTVGAAAPCDATNERAPPIRESTALYAADHGLCGASACQHLSTAPVAHRYDQPGKVAQLEYHAGMFPGPVEDTQGDSGPINHGRVATKAVPNEGIYVVRNAADEVYVGQSGNITSRLGQHVSTGKFTQAKVDAAQRFEVLGGKTSREIAEQLNLDSFGGRDAPGVLNKVNPIGDRRLNLLPPDCVRP